MAGNWNIDSTDVEILDLIESEGPTTPSAISFKLGRAKSMVWRRLLKLNSMGLVGLKKVGGVLVAYRLYERMTPGLVKVGILRASEYPYILEFVKLLKDRFTEVRVEVYDEAFKLGLGIASNKVQIALAPLPTLVLAHRLSSGRVKVVGGGSYGGAFILEGRSGSGHATTMASTMEMCAELHKLEQPRHYKSSGGEILESVLKGESKYGIVWEPYASLGAKEGLKTHKCGTELCCLLGVNVNSIDNPLPISRALEKAIGGARRGAYDVSAYANLLRLPVDMVRDTVKSYEYYDDMPKDVISRNWSLVRSAVVPDLSLGDVLLDG